MDVLLFSKFSPSSKKLLIQLEKTPDILKALSIICIDNKKIRQQVLNDTKVKVSFLPCLIRLNDDTNNFDIYEGQNVFDFFSNIQQHILEESRLEKIRMEEERLQQKAEEIRMEQIRIQNMQMTKDENPKKVSFTSIDDLDENPKKVSFTSIDDLDKGIGTYIHIEKDNLDKERDINTKNAEMVVKSSSGNLLTKAMKMQKERETK